MCLPFLICNYPCCILKFMICLFGLGKLGTDFGDVGECKGDRQSPIDLVSDNMVTKALPPIQYSGEYAQVPSRMTATGGHSLVIGVEYPDGAVPTICGGPLPMDYKLAQFHFHWAQRDGVGSEHTVNGKYYLMEMHAVHIKANLTFEEAVEDPEGIAVIGYFYEYSQNDDPSSQALIETFAQILQNREEPVTLPNPFPLDQIIKPISCDYVTYLGSLTTPPCTENVRWMVSSYTNFISRKQMAQFRSLSANQGVDANNFRQVQKLNGRTVNYVTAPAEQRGKSGKHHHKKGVH